MYRSISTRAASSTRRKWRGVVAALTMLGATVGGAALAAPASAASSTTVVVNAGSIQPNGTWALEATGNTGSYNFVPGPATPPLGTGSLRFNIASGQHEWLNNYQYGECATGPACNSPASMTKITDIDALSFSTYRASGTTYPTLNVEVWSTGVSGSYTTLVFLPDAAAVASGTWQHWDALNPADGAWYSTHALPGGALACAPQSAGCTTSWSQIQTDYPNAKVVFGIGPNVGTGGTFTGNIDNLAVGVSTNTTVFDFEPEAACTTTCYVNGTTGSDLNSGQSNDPLKTIQAGLDAVSSGGVVQVSAGTYAENLTVSKALTLAGASQSGTKIIPAVSDPNCGGAGGGSLCAGGSNVVLVQSSNVTIHDLTIDGDNPGLTSGVTVGGADLDARNGIITDHSNEASVFQALSVHNVTVKNVFLRGIYASTGGSFNLSNNTVQNVQADPGSIGIFDFGGGGTITGNTVSNANDAISANHSSGTTFANNTITGSGSGVHTDNAGDAGGTPDVITGNHVSTCKDDGYGVWTFVPYLSPTVTGNTVSGCAVGLAELGSCDDVAGSVCPGGNVPTTTFTSNSTDGMGATFSDPDGTSIGLYVTTNSFGFGDRNVQASANHNTITNSYDGVYVEETGTAVTTVAANRNSITGNTNSGFTNAGATNADATCNWWGQASGPVAGEVVGPVTTNPYLITSNLDGNCTPIVKIGTADKSVVEGNGGNTPVNLAVTLDRKSSQTVKVVWNTQNGAAGAGDYVGAFGQLTFAPGQTSKTITVQVKGDTVVEPNEAFAVKLSSPTNATLGNALENVVIKNDDKPTISIANVSVAEGNPAVFTVTISQPYYQPIVIDVSSADGTATAPTDYTAVAAGRTITIPAGQTSRTISVATKIDHVSEPNQGFKLTFSSTSVTNGPKTATATIQANNT
jgi:parallel beta-helix repeat protein